MSNNASATPVGSTHPVSGATLLRRLTFWTLLDSHEPTRNQAAGELEEWRHRDGRVVRSLTDGQQLKDAHRAVYLMDDGRTVAPWYVAGWSKENTITLTPFPVNVNEDGTPRLRADRPEPVDYSTWALGPRRAYHLKVREA